MPRPSETDLVRTLSLASDPELRRRYKLIDEPVLGNIRFGLLLEVLDKLAEECALGYARRLHPEARVVTAAVDNIYVRSAADVSRDMIFRARINFVGRTSMEVGIRVEHPKGPQGEAAAHIASCYFTMVARSGAGEGATSLSVPPLSLLNGLDRRRSERAVARREAYRASLQQALEPPSREEYTLLSELHTAQDKPGGLEPVPKPPRTALGAPGSPPQGRRDEPSGSKRFEPDAAGGSPPPQPEGTTSGGRSAASAPLTYEPHGPAGPSLRSIPPDAVAARGGFGTGSSILLASQCVTSGWERTYPEHENVPEKIFGGHLIRRAYEQSSICAEEVAPDRPVIVAVNRINFFQPVRMGDKLQFISRATHTGKTSICVETDIIRISRDRTQTHLSNTCVFTFVNVDESLIPKLVPRIHPTTYAEDARWLSAHRRWLDHRNRKGWEKK